MKFVEKFLRSIQKNPSSEELAVISVVGSSERKKVYNLTVEQAHLYYANGVLVTNTDSEDHIGDEARYKLLSIGIGAKGGRTTGTQ